MRRRLRCCKAADNKSVNLRKTCLQAVSLQAGFLSFSEAAVAAAKAICPASPLGTKAAGKGLPDLLPAKGLLRYVPITDVFIGISAAGSPSLLLGVVRTALYCKRLGAGDVLAQGENRL